MAIKGGLLRRSMWRWSEGMVLKKLQPGNSNVWIIMGLSHCSYQQNERVAVKWKQSGSGSVHGEMIPELHDPDGAACDLDDAEEQVEALHNGAVDGPAACTLPFAVAFPREVVEAEGCAAHGVTGSEYISIVRVCNE